MFEGPTQDRVVDSSLVPTHEPGDGVELMGLVELENVISQGFRRIVDQGMIWLRFQLLQFGLAGKGWNRRQQVPVTLVSDLVDEPCATD